MNDCWDARGCRTKTCSDKCEIDATAEAWLTERHSEDWFIGGAPQKEWDDAYMAALAMMDILWEDK